MSEPTTAAGRGLLARLSLDVPWFIAGSKDTESALVAAIEAEAVANYRASLAAKVRELGTDHFESCGGYGCSAGRNTDWDAVLDLIEKETR